MWRTPVPDVVIAPADVNIDECWRISVTENLEFHSVSDMLMSCIYSAPEARLFNMHTKQNTPRRWLQNAVPIPSTNNKKLQFHNLFTALRASQAKLNFI